MVLTAPVSIADTHVHRLFALYARLPVGVVTQCAANHAQLLHDAWQADPTRPWGDNAQALFERCDDYVFELLHAASTRSRRQQAWADEHVWDALLAAGPRVLDFGGGLGLASSLLASAGKQVTYCDVEGPAARFAAWLFARAAQPVQVLCTPAALPALPAGQHWDAVLAEHVLEHVADPAAVAAMLARAVAPGGLLVLAVDPGAARVHAQRVDLEQLRVGCPALAAMQCVAPSAAGRLLLRRG